MPLHLEIDEKKMNELRLKQMSNNREVLKCSSKLSQAIGDMKI